MRVIHRDDLPTLRTAIVDGVEQNLGILKDFSKHREIASFIPEQARLAIAWVRLGPGERLETHLHPIESMIVVAEGHGRTAGDLDEPFSGGDIVLIPRGCRHGFVGSNPSGFWALSVQFELQGLYEDPEHALVTFDAAIEQEDPTFAGLLRRNGSFVEAHVRNPLFALLRSGRLADRGLRARFLDVVQAWSTHFQQAMLARSAFTDDPSFAGPFRAHLSEEFGHDVGLAADRGPTGEAVWDPVLDAAGSWFAREMIAADNADKAVLVHLVLEAGAEAVAPLGAAAFADAGETAYFDTHEAADPAHRRMVDDLLSGLDERTYSRLFETQRRGWAMLELLSARIAELTERSGP